MIRTLDVILSLLGLLILFPLFIILAFCIAIDSKGGVFYHQTRVGRNGVNFKLIKFRSMKSNADTSGLLTIGSNDSRITKVGLFIRKYKLDELPQLINVLKGEMSMVGPRPEVKKYTDLYTEEQKKVFSVRPGITDWASIRFRNENEILTKSANPEKIYIEEIMPRKIGLNQIYLQDRSVLQYFKIILYTIF